MKNQPVKRILFLMFMIISLHEYSQQWNPKTAYWIYDVPLVEYQGDLRVSYLRDTVVNGKDCQLLKKDMIIHDGILDLHQYKLLGHEVTYSASGVTYILNNNHFDTLYYFSGKINERYKITDRLKWRETDSAYAVIADTGSVTINTHKLKWQAVDYFFERQGNHYTLRDTIIEKIGTTKCYFLPWDYINGGVDGNEGGSLKCFRDSTLGVYSTRLSTDCKFDLSLLYPKSYKPFISESKMWKYVQTVWLTDGSEGANYLVNHVYFKGDTIVDTIKYKKLYKKPEQPIAGKAYLAYLMREDNINQKVYVYDPQYKKEELLYDFKLNKGDEFNIYIVDKLFIKQTVAKVDTISSYSLNLKRIMFNDSITWIEGLGTITYRIIPSEGELYCVTDHDMVMYMDPTYNNCDTIFPRGPWNDVRSIKSYEVMVYPHPVTRSSVLRVNSHPTERLKIEIYSYSGALIKEDYFTGNYPIGSHSLEGGLYVYRISNNKQLIKADKLIVNHP